MTIPTFLQNLVGQWAGSNKLWLGPTEPVRESATTAAVATVAQGKFLTVHYTWADEGKPQDGLLTLGFGAQGNGATAVWIDSWHQNTFMLCQGQVDAQTAVSVTGAYAAPPGPDWGWQIQLKSQSEQSFEMLMYNVWPEGKAELAVQAVYVRQR